MNGKHQAWLRAAALLFSLSATPAVLAQGQPPQPPQPPPDFPNTTPRPPSIRERQIIMDEMVREAGKGEPPRRSEELRMAEISEDYRELQQVNNKMMAAVMRSSEPDYDLIVKSVTEIRRRAERLRQNLALPAPDTESKAPPKPIEDTPSMKRALLALDRSIMSFVRSPLFNNTDVLNAEAATKTARDLTEVIELSGRAVKDAERLRKKDKN